MYFISFIVFINKLAIGFLFERINLKFANLWEEEEEKKLEAK